MTDGAARIGRRDRARKRKTRHAIIACGSREWKDAAAVRTRLAQYPWGTIVIHGDWYTGADDIADTEARKLGLEVLPVQYLSEHGRAGGPRRNQLMLDLLLSFRKHGYAVTVEAFDLGGRGTAHMMEIARKAAVRVVRTEGTPP